jgi:GTP-binding protein
MTQKNNIKKPLIVIFGRTNVGKSTLFNRLFERNQALVSEIEGTTRDANHCEISWCGYDFKLVDTGGIMDLKYLNNKKIKTDDIDIKVQQQAKDYLKSADLILLLVDNKTGLLPADRLLAEYLKKTEGLSEKTLLVANKTDNQKERPNTAEFNKLGLNEPISISAASGSGTGDLLDIIVEKIFPKSKQKPKKETGYEEDSAEKITEDNARVSIIGKPNVGKSSLINAILGYERVITSPLPHTTREPQDTEIIFKDQKITLVDTAGISKHGHKTKGLEKFGIQKSLSALQRSDVALFVVDISEPLTHQDSKIIEEIVKRKASFMIIANKWDKIEEKDTKKFTQYIYSKFPFADYAQIQFVSALTGLKVDKILDLIIFLREQRKIQISDSALGKLLNKLVKIHRPPKSWGEKYPRIFELRQVKFDPPVFEVQIGSRDTLQPTYLRFIENQLRKKFGFSGSPITIRLTHGKKIHGKAE